MLTEFKHFYFTGGGLCWTDAQCNFPVGGGCAGASNSCVCVNGYTGAFCQTGEQQIYNYNLGGSLHQGFYNL